MYLEFYLELLSKISGIKKNFDFINDSFNHENKLVFEFLNKKYAVKNII